MPDISMCGGEGCVLKSSCYRHPATPSQYYQAWFVGIPVTKQGEQCEFYIQCDRPRNDSEKPNRDGSTPDVAGQSDSADGNISTD
jgi:hypothetical protein